MHAIMVNRELQRISRVPRESGEDTKFASVVGIVQVVSKRVYACEALAVKIMRMM